MQKLSLITGALLALTALAVPEPSEAMPVFPVTLAGTITLGGVPGPGSIVLEANGDFTASTALGGYTGTWEYIPGRNLLRGGGTAGRFRGTRSGSCFSGQVEITPLRGTWQGCVQP